MNTSELILPTHLTRRAVVYVRQSTPQQITHSQEGLKLQYALTHRAVELGWPEASIEVVDVDLGRSGATTEGRVGFQELVAEAALGQIGILIAYDATRLARNCSHWYQLLDLCGRMNCLIADRDGVYDPSSVNGRLLLGLKGQISELELHTIKARLTAGVLNKAKRGELGLMLPTGLERTATGEVVKTPDREVQDRLTLIFETMLQQRTAPKVMRVLRDQNLLIPRRDHYGDIQWRQPTTGLILNILRNPAYAGAFAYGRSRIRYENGVATKRRDYLPADQWKALVKDKYPAYVSWEDFEKIGAMLRDNHSEYQRRMTRGVPRDGKALLQGVVHCGHCGRKMTIQYKGKPRYSCSHLASSAGEPVCQTVWSDTVDQRALACFFEALSVAEIDLADRTLQESDRRRDELLRGQYQQVDRLRHAAHLAERQYRHSEPENRLVTAELELRWEAALRELKTVEEALKIKQQQSQCWAIPADLLEMLKEIGPALPELWDQGVLSWSQKKSLFRCLVEKVVLKRDNDQVTMRIVWRGGDVTEEMVPITVGRFEQLSDAKQMETTIIAMARERKTDKQIAAHLTQAGHRSPRSNVVLPSTATRIRMSHGIIHMEVHPTPHLIAGYLRPHQLAKRLQIKPHWIYDRIRNGTIQVAKNATHKTCLFPDTPETIKQFKKLLRGDITMLAF
ncbi:MAG: recombinase family protein [Pirellulales bacterium]